MAVLRPKTDYVRRRLADRPMGPDEYVEDLFQLERLLASPEAMGVASVMAFLNLLSRYPREYDAIRLELGAVETDTGPEEERITELLEERLRLAERRNDAAGTFL